MKRFLVFELADHRNSKAGASECFVGAFETVEEVNKIVKEQLFVEVYDAQLEKFVDIKLVKN